MFTYVYRVLRTKTERRKTEMVAPPLKIRLLMAMKYKLMIAQ